jgi:DNA-binding PadR family transcriptional regulator
MLKFIVLALLGRRPQHGYDLRTAFEELLGGTWLLNIGQVYTTLSRLEQDGLVIAEVVPQELLPDRKVYSLTELGEKELRRWLEEPLGGIVRMRDEVFLKVIAQGVVDPAGAPGLIAAQRAQYLDAIRELAHTRHDDGVAATTGLLLDGLLLRLEADLQWLDRCETFFRERR